VLVPEAEAEVVEAEEVEAENMVRGGRRADALCPLIVVVGVRSTLGAATAAFCIGAGFGAGLL
jgi:hypothetical protein